MAEAHGLHACVAMGNTQALVVVRDAKHESAWRDAHVARTMLDMIAWLEGTAAAAVTVVLEGELARDHELAMFLRETYPAASVVAGPARDPSR